MDEREQDQHSPEPWHVIQLMLAPIETSCRIFDADYQRIAVLADGGLDGGADALFRLADARRIVACVNACRGIPAEALELRDDPDNPPLKLIPAADYDRLAEAAREALEYVPDHTLLYTRLRDLLDPAPEPDPR